MSQSRITADTALRLARYFGTTDRFWLNLQTPTTSKSRRNTSEPPPTGSSRSRLSGFRGAAIPDVRKQVAPRGVCDENDVALPVTDA